MQTCNISLSGVEMEYGNPKPIRIFNKSITDLSGKSAKKVGGILSFVSTLIPKSTQGETVVNYSWDGRIFSEVLLWGKKYFLYLESIMGENPSLENLSYFSGMCLFDTKSVIGNFQDTSVSLVHPKTIIDQKIESLTINPCITLYEAETITKNLSFLEKVSPTSQANISFHLPEIEYFLYLADAYNQGFLSPELYGEYIKSISQKVSKMTEVIRKRIAPSLQERVTFECPLEMLRDFILQGIADWIPLNLEKMIQLLETAWMFEFFPYDVNTFQDLVYFSYIYAYRNALESWPLLAIENPSEISILRNLKKKIQESVLPNTLTWLYLHPTTILENGDFTYFTQEPATLWNLKKICRDYIKK